MFNLYFSKCYVVATIAILTAAFVALPISANNEPLAENGKSESAAEEASKQSAKKYDLRYKLKRGEVLRYDVTHRASIRSTIDETTQAAQTRTDSVKVWKVTDVLPSGEIEFMNVVERVHMVNQLPDRESAEYDSEKDKTPPPGFEDAARSVGVPLSLVRITPRGNVVRREAKLGGQNVEEDAPVALRLPEKPIAVGDTWDDPFEISVTLQDGGSKSIQTRRHHKLANVANGIAAIEVTYQVLSPIDAPIECQLVQRLMEGEVKFDIESGRIAGQRMDIDKRILGFAGPTSSMQYIMRMEEKLLPKQEKVAAKQPQKPSASQKTSRQDSTRRASTRSKPQRSTQTKRK